MVARSGYTSGGEDNVDWDEIWRRRLEQQRRAAISLHGGANDAKNAVAGRTMASGGIDPARPDLQSPGVDPARPGAIYDAASPSAIEDAAGRVNGEGGTTGGEMTQGDAAQRIPGDSRINATGGLPYPFDPSNKWYTGRYTEGTLGALADDPSRWATAYAMSQGYGKGVENVLNQYLDPGAAFLLSLKPGDQNNPNAKMDFVGGMNDFALQKENGTWDWGSPQDVIAQILGASGVPQPGQEASPVGAMLYPEGDWNGQVSNTLQFTQQALYGRMAPEVLGPYMANLERQGQLFLEYKAMNPTDTRNFGQWVIDTVGPYGGL